MPADDKLPNTEPLFRVPEPARSRWHRAGLSRRAERVLDVISGIVLTLLVVGWSWSIAHAANAEEAAALSPAARRVTAALTRADAPSAAFLTQTVLEALVPLRGLSGKLQADVRPVGDTLPLDSLPAGARVAYTSGGTALPATAPAAPREAGVWDLAIGLGNAIRPIADFRVITLRPFSDKQRGRIGRYLIGAWPGERARARAGYANPRGFIEVTPENQDTRVSEHFRLRDFLTKGQANVWPKYLVLDLQLVDKLELVLSDLASRGVPVDSVRVMSGFRTPSYNATGGRTTGRAELSRHMYGDAADIYIDANGDHAMDDLDRDGRITIEDARLIVEAVDRVERQHPTLIGGTGLYRAGPGHGPFIHIDTRGYRARW